MVPRGKAETVRCVIEWRDDGETHTLEALMLHCERKGAKPMDVVAMMTACCSHEDLQYLIKEGLTDEVYASLRVQAEKLETSKEFSGFLANSAWRGKKDSKAVKNCVASWDALSHYCNVDDIVCFSHCFWSAMSKAAVGVCCSAEGSRARNITC